MAGVVLLTTMSWTVDMHYCGDTLVDFSFVQQVETCGMDQASMMLMNDHSTLTEKSCCTDKQVIKEGENDLKVPYDQLSLEQQVILSNFVYSYLNLFEGTESKETPFVDYAPPFVKRDVQVLHQSFLI